MSINEDPLRLHEEIERNRVDYSDPLLELSRLIGERDPFNESLRRHPMTDFVTPELLEGLESLKLDFEQFKRQRQQTHDVLGKAL